MTSAEPQSRATPQSRSDHDGAADLPAERGVRPLPWGWCALLTALLTVVLFNDGPLLRLYFDLDLPYWTDPVEDWLSDWGHLVAIGLGVALLLFRDRHMALHAAVVVLVASLVVFLMKALFGRARPGDAGDPMLFFGLTFEHDAFPSGHTAAIWAAVFVVMRGYPKLGWLWFAFGLLVAWGRLHTQAHYPSDLLAGAFVAFGLDQFLRALGRHESRASNPETPPTTAPTSSSSSSSSSSSVSTPASAPTPRTPNTSSIPGVSDGARPRRWRIALPWLIVVCVPPMIAWPARTPVPPRIAEAEREAIVRELYSRILGRPVDDQAYDLWMDRIPRVRVVSDPVFQFARSGEFYRSIKSRNAAAEDRIEDLYHRLLDRAPSPGERARAEALMADPARLRFGTRLLATRLLLSREYLERFGPFAMPGDPRFDEAPPDQAAPISDSHPHLDPHSDSDSESTTTSPEHDASANAHESGSNNAEPDRP